MEELLGLPTEGRELRPALPIELLPMGLLPTELVRGAALLEVMLLPREALLDFARVVFPLELRLALLRDFARAELRGLAFAVLRFVPRADLAFALERARDFFAPPRDELDFFRLADERLRDDDDLALLRPLEPFAIGSPF